MRVMCSCGYATVYALCSVEALRQHALYPLCISSTTCCLLLLMHCAGRTAQSSRC